MASTLISPKSNSKKSTSSNSSSNGNSNETPITEEELQRKETPITAGDVLRLRKVTHGKIDNNRKDKNDDICVCLDYLTETDDNVYKIDFVHFRIRDMRTNRVLFEVERGSGRFLF